MWDVMVPFRAGDGPILTDSFTLALPCLMDGLLAEAGTKRCLYFFP